MADAPAAVRLNRGGPRAVNGVIGTARPPAAAARRHSARVVHYNTDYLVLVNVLGSGVATLQELLTSARYGGGPDPRWMRAGIGLERAS
jgi:hypothetical protein